jgi:hypothetical protein
MAAGKALQKIKSFKSEKDPAVQVQGADEAMKNLKKRVSTLLPPHVLLALEEAERLKKDIKNKREPN